VADRKYITISEYLSAKFKVISFVLIVLVIFRHSYNIVLNLSTESIEIQEGYSSFFQNFILNVINRIPSSLFFIISGFFFFLNFNNETNEFIQKFKKRLKSIALPYLIWSIWGILFLFILQLLPDYHDFFTKGLIRDYSISQILNVIFINPIPYQLWFLKDLFVLICIAPVIYFLIKYLRIYIVIIAAIVWLLGYEFGIIYTRSLFFFVLGAFLSKKGKFLEKKDLSKIAYFLIFAWLILSMFLTLKGFNQLYSRPTFLYSLLNNSIVLLGITSIWAGYDKFFKNKDLLTLKDNSSVYYTFFLFAFHEPVLTLIRKGFFFVTGTGELFSFLIFLFGPVVVIYIGVFTGRILERFTPWFYRIITGGRNKISYSQEPVYIQGNINMRF
jgi:hypothetical protein